MKSNESSKISNYKLYDIRQGVLVWQGDIKYNGGRFLYGLPEQEAVWVDHEYIWNLRVTAYRNVICGIFVSTRHI